MTKEETSDLDKVRKAYFDELSAKFKRAEALFKIRDQTQCYSELEALISMA